MEGRFNKRLFALQVWGGLYLEGLIHGGACFRNFTVSFIIHSKYLRDSDWLKAHA